MTKLGAGHDASEKDTEKLPVCCSVQSTHFSNYVIISAVQQLRIQMNVDVQTGVCTQLHCAFPCMKTPMTSRHLQKLAKQ